MESPINDLSNAFLPDPHPHIHLKDQIFSVPKESESLVVGHDKSSGATNETGPHPTWVSLPACDSPPSNATPLLEHCSSPEDVTSPIFPLSPDMAPRKDSVIMHPAENDDDSFSTPSQKSEPIHLSRPVDAILLKSILQMIYDEQNPSVDDGTNDWIVYSPTDLRSQRSGSIGCFTQSEYTSSDSSVMESIDAPQLLCSGYKRKRSDSLNSPGALAPKDGSENIAESSRKFKKCKLSCSNSAHILPYHATERASSRVARSLSVSCLSTQDSERPVTSLQPCSGCNEANEIHPPPLGALDLIDASRKNNNASPISYIVAITSPAIISRNRINRILEREMKYRLRDGLSEGMCGSFSASCEHLDDVAGISLTLRSDAIEWLLDVEVNQTAPGSQLQTHLENHAQDLRFQAIVLFCRYFLRKADFAPQEHNLPQYMIVSMNRFIWDIALGCLTIAIKFNHDFLEPFSPILTDEFCELSQVRTSEPDLETIQRNILEMFDHEIYGISPHALMEELWCAVPSLRRFLDFHGAWLMVKWHAWDFLNMTTYDIDFFRFPISLLTASALLEATYIVLCKQFKHLALSNSLTPPVSNDSQSEKSAPGLLLADSTLPPSPSDPLFIVKTRAAKKARKYVELAAVDVAEIVSLSKVELQTCRDWVLRQWND